MTQCRYKQRKELITHIKKIVDYLNTRELLELCEYLKKYTRSS